MSKGNDLRAYIFEILDDPIMSFLAQGREGLLGECVGLLGFGLSADQTETHLHNILEQRSDEGLEALLDVFRERKSEIQQLHLEREAEWQRREDQIERTGSSIVRKRDELGPIAQLVTNEDLEGVDILVESLLHVDGNSYILCHIKGEPEKPLKFKSTQLQSGSFYRLEAPYPFARRVVRTPKRRMWILVEPENVNALLIDDLYVFRVISGRYNSNSFKGAQEIVNRALSDYFDSGSHTYSVPLHELPYVESVFSETDYFDLNVVADTAPYVVVAGTEEEPIWSDLTESMYTFETPLSKKAVAVRTAGNQSLYYMATIEQMLARTEEVTGEAGKDRGSVTIRIDHAPLA